MTSIKGMAAIGLVAMALVGCSSMTGGRDTLVAEPDACAPKRFDVYFAENQAGLTDAARTAIGMTATQLQGCEIRSVRVLGLADATGAADANLTLSGQRALAVVEALEAAGWPAPAFEVGAGGDAGAVTPGGVEEPLRRRAEVLVTAAPAGQ
jgi:outer membrane protein OmpA-like peptidoglycan-associated protein